MKRLFDICFSLLILILFSPLYFLIALLIKLSSKGPVVYLSPRVGKGGKIFQCYKFRTMRTGANETLAIFLAKDPSLQKEWETFRKLKNDPRVTPLGAYLRKTSLDELPQFWNVLKGDLSVVGPRPVSEEEVREWIGDKAPKILSVRPGITGLWQTSGRSTLSLAERIHLEETYVDNQSFFLDLCLICKTIPMILFPKGAC